MKICIIGAGPSGIAAAVKLIENGFTDLCLLEAESRIGGRVHTIPFGDGFIEKGAQFCHGTTNNPVYDLASKHNYLSDPPSGNSSLSMYDSNGVLIPSEKSNKLFGLAGVILTSLKDLRSYKGSLGSFFMEKYWAALQDEKYNDIDAKLRSQFAKLYHQAINVFDSADNSYLSSCHGKVSEELTGGNRIWNTTSKGFQTILDLLQKKYPDQGEPIDIMAHTQLDKVVKKITYNLNDSSTPIHIECTDGSVCDAEHVICTVSLGVLQECHLSLFDPILPQKKIDSIESITFGVVAKVVLEFDRPFWPAKWGGCVAVWNPEQLKSIRENEETRWLEDVTGFLPYDNQPNVIIGWTSGESARQMESLPDDTVIKHSIMWLKIFLKDFEIPDAPKNFVRSQWYSNPHFRGSYASISVVTDAMKVSNNDLAEPLLNVDNKRPVIQFAGDSTDHHYSTVNGAIVSGRREADRLIEYLNEKK